MYFDSFPIIQYGSSDGAVKNVTNLLKRIAVRSKLKTNVSFFDTYDVKNGETPEIIADKLYDDPKLHWVVMLFNDVTDRYHDWPMSQTQFNQYMTDKYGTDQGGIHHYEIDDDSGDRETKIDIGTSNSLYPSATAITNLEYEQALQDKKRKIRLLDPRFVDDFVREFNAKIKETVI